MLCRHPVCPNPALYALPRWFFGTGGAPFFWGAVGFAQKDPGRIGGKNYFSGEGAKNTSENAAALCAFAREMSSAKNTFCAKPVPCVDLCR